MTLPLATSMPPSAGRRRRRRAGAGRSLGLLLMLCVMCPLLGPGCGDGAPLLDGKRIVLQRDFAWTSQAPTAVDPLGASWAFTSGEGPWSARLGVSHVDDGALVLEGDGEVVVAGPWSGFRVDSELHHLLRMELATQGAGEVRVYWRLPGAAFDNERSFAVPLDDTEEPRPLTLRLSTLKNALNAPDASEGFSELLMRFSASVPDGPLSVRLASIGLASDYEQPEGQGHLVAPLERRGVRMPGIAWRLPGAVSAAFEVGPGERLRFAAAVAGRGCEGTLTLRDEDGLLEPVTTRLTNRSAWRWVEVDLSAAAGHTLRLTFDAQLHEASGRTSVDPDDKSGVLLLGGVLRLGPARSVPELPPAAPGATAASEPPDVLLYVVDTLRSDRLGTYGYGPPTDPVLQELAAEGVVFERVVSASNWTRPSTSTMLTGSGAEVHGNHAPGDVVDPLLPTLAESLAAEGYLTVSFVTNHHAASWSGLDRGFDIQHEPRHFPREQPDTSLTSQLVERPLRRFLEEHADERLFVYVHTLDPHGPYLPPEEDRAQLATSDAPRPELPAGSEEERAKAHAWQLAYDAEILHNDRRLGSLMQTLQELGLDDNSLLAFSSDHGESFFEHGHWTHWRSLYEEELLVPWVLRWPLGLPAGRRVPGVAGHADLAPTLLGLVGAEVPDAWTGDDLSDVARGAGVERIPERILVSDAAMLGGPLAPAERLLVVRRGPLKLIARADGRGGAEPVALYDLATDPAEAQDLLPTRAPDAGLLGALQEYLDTDARRAAGVVDRPDAPVDAARLEWLKAMGYIR